MSQTITIHFIKNDKTLTDKPEPGTRPVIKVTINPSSGDDHCISINEKKKSVFALVDTGADDFYVDEELVNELGLPLKTGVKSTRLISGVTETESTQHNAIMKIDDINKSFGVSLTKIKTSSFGFHYQVILGMSLIRLGKLTMDSVNNIYTLTLPDEI